MNELLREIECEVLRAEEKHSRFVSLHEGWAVLYEEVDELWDEVKKAPTARSNEAARKECIQIAAMAIRIVRDLCSGRAEK